MRILAYNDLKLVPYILQMVAMGLILGCGKDALHKVCPYQCLSADQETWDPKKVDELEKQMGKGVCSYGVGTCDENYNLISCEGAVLPSEEMCDNVDNNCNGVTDEVWLMPWQGTWPYKGVESYPCMTLGECGKDSMGVCIDGQWTCRYGEDTVELPEEVSCDGKDNDCDGRIDEDVFDSLPLSERVCYSGNPTESLAYPPCRAGVIECLYGETICLNEVTPSVELCDRIDNDCNGVIDDTGDVMLTKYDIVFIVDTSGSMCDEIAAVAGACNAYAEQFDGNPNFRFALVIMSMTTGARVQVDTDFTDFANIRDRLLTLGCNGSGAEASLDSMEQVCDRADNPLGLSWREDAYGLFFAFTDEMQQSYTSPLTTPQMVIDSCLLSGTLPFIWSHYPAQFGYIAAGANGIHFSLVNDWVRIFNDMNSVVITLCGAGG